VAKVGRIVPWVIHFAIWGAAVPADAQNFDVGKSPAQIFSDTCNACHRSPREIKQTTLGFMREHYTTSGQQAAAMVAYLASVGSDPHAVKQRRPPALGAGQVPTETTLPQSPPQETDQAAIRPPQTIPPDADQAGLPESQGVLPATSPARQTTPAAGEPAKPSVRAKSSQGTVATATIKHRRPSESVEILQEGAALPLRQQNSVAAFEE
jgi:hypothetical protein